MIFPAPCTQYYDILRPFGFLSKGLSMNEFIGTVFGKWKIISFIRQHPKSGSIFLCRCECDFEREIGIYALRRGKTTQCKKCFIQSKNEKNDLIVGKRFGSSIVLNRLPNNRREVNYLCRCDCGREREVLGYRLKSLKSTKCPHCRVKTHGMSQTIEFKIWADMLSRCRNSNHKSYKHYGGRGIVVCKRWSKFENFFKDMGLRPVDHQIDRINNNGNYEPVNCRWATRSQNASNRRTIAQMIYGS